jgi:MinD-like ATPase involved in chromosome partitioning or flagellar assembly
MKKVAILAQKGGAGKTTIGIHTVALTDSARDLRDIALLRLGRDTLARRSELVAIDLSDFENGVDGSATIIIRRSKTGKALSSLCHPQR